MVVLILPISSIVVVVKVVDIVVEVASSSLWNVKKYLCILKNHFHIHLIIKIIYQKKIILIILYLLVYHVNLSSKAHPVSQHLFPDNSLAVQSRLPISAHFSWASLKFVWKHCLGRIQFCPSLLQQLTAPVGWWRDLIICSNYWIMIYTYIWTLYI